MSITAAVRLPQLYTLRATYQPLTLANKRSPMYNFEESPPGLCPEPNDMPADPL